MRGEPEPGSVIEARTDAFAQADKRIALGREQRTCDVCGKEWIGPDRCRQDGCNSAIFTSRTIRPTSIEIRGWDGRTPIVGTVTETPSKLIVGAEDIEVLRRLSASLLDVENRLLSADAMLHQLVNFSAKNAEIFSFLQASVHGLTDANFGDFDLRATAQVTALSLLMPCRALRAEIERVLERYEEEKNRYA